jgi:hypothetical protein
VSEVGLDIAASPRSADAGTLARGVRTAVVGVSAEPTCGVRDYAVLLADALAETEVSYSLHWLQRHDASMRATRSQIQAWARAIGAAIERSRPDAILLHYSVFTYAYRGIPLFVRSTLSPLRRTRVPIITIAHECAYPWGYGVWRGDVWALTQRVGFIDVVRASTALVATTDFRAEWIASRAWLPKRPVAVAPVFSTLPPPSGPRRSDRQTLLIGLFGYAYQGAAMSVVVDAVRLLVESGAHVELALLGAPGRPSAAADAWLQAARIRGVESALSFSGTLPAQGLSDALAACDVLLFADPSGPTARKTTLAASLASGRPVVAIDGPLRWSKLVQSGSAEVVEPTPDAVAEALRALLADEDRREALGARGRAFAEREMSVRRSVEVVAGVLSDLTN